MLIGGTSFIAGKVLGPLFSKFVYSPGSPTTLIKKESTTFRVSEDKKSLSIYDDTGAEVLFIDKQA